jgi:hypothetical protein
MMMMMMMTMGHKCKRNCLGEISGRKRGKAEGTGGVKRIKVIYIHIPRNNF